VGDKVLEMRERLGDREAALRRREVLAEERDGDVVAGARLLGERRVRLLQAPVVVLGELSRPLCRRFDRLAVARVRDLRVELDEPLEVRR
jgi:hypothetical protein